MKLNAPKQTTWWIALVIGLLGILFELGLFTFGVISAYGFWFVAVAYVILLLSTALKGF